MPVERIYWDDIRKILALLGKMLKLQQVSPFSKKIRKRATAASSAWVTRPHPRTCADPQISSISSNRYNISPVFGFIEAEDGFH